jgi:hypothetical protein
VSDESVISIWLDDSSFNYSVSVGGINWHHGNSFLTSFDAFQSPDTFVLSDSYFLQRREEQFGIQ